MSQPEYIFELTHDIVWLTLDVCAVVRVTIAVSRLPAKENPDGTFTVYMFGYNYGLTKQYLVGCDGEHELSAHGELPSNTTCPYTFEHMRELVRSAFDAEKAS